MNYISILNFGRHKLNKSRIQTSILDTEIILSYVLNISREKLLCNLNKKLNKNQLKLFKNLIELRARRMPVAYITNKKEFWKNNFLMNKSVLIPRPETELLVDKILKKIKINERKNILDIGTGSGCILISVLRERHKCIGTGLDISKSAINVAKINAKIQQVENRITFIHSDIDKFYSNKYDFIVSNPPYIKKLELDVLKEDVKKFEPTKALDGGISGVDIYKKVITKGSKLLKIGGNLILEIEETNIFKLTSMLVKKKFFVNEILQDINGYKRCLIATKL